MKLFSPFELLKESLNLTKTETDIVWVLWSLEAKDFSANVDQQTNRDEELVFLENIKAGVSVKDLKQLLTIAQPTLQVALSSLMEKGYLSRKKVGRSYFYRATETTFKTFQEQLQTYSTGLGRLLAPFIHNVTPKSAIKDMYKQLSNAGWKFTGWQEISGHMNFLVSNTTMTDKLSEKTLEHLNLDSHGQILASYISQFFWDNFLQIKVFDALTSPFQVECRIAEKLWALQS